MYNIYIMDRNFEIIQSLKRKIFLSLRDNPRISLKDISLLSGFSIKHTQELFFKQNKITIGKYVKKILLSKAALLLVLTRKRIIDISLDTGFSSQQSFNRAFKKEFSLPPMRYRKRGIIDCKKLISELKSDKKFIYIGEEYLSSIKISATFIRFKDNVLTSENVMIQKKRLLKIKSSLSKTNHIIIISSIQPMESRDNKIYINSFFCSPIETGEEITTVEGMYHKIRFKGTLDDYINIGRNIVFYIKIPFSLKVIEEFKINKKKLDINIYIPKK